MNILRRELRGGLRTLLIWILVLGAFNVLMMGIFPSFSRDAERAQDLMNLFPESMIKALGLNLIDLSDPIGYYALEVYLVVILLGSVFAAMLGAGILAKEEDDKTVEFLLARPVARTSVLLQKVSAYVVILVAFNVGLAALSFVAFGLFVRSAYSMAALFRLFVAPFFAHLTFASLGFLAALFFTRRRTVYAVSIGLAMGSYFIGLVSQLAEGLAPLRWLAPTRYVESVDIVVNGRLDLGNLAILLAISVAAVGTAIALYRRRDITI